MSAPYTPDPIEPQKRRLSGVAIAMLILAGLVTTCGVTVFIFVRSEAGQALIQTTRDVVAIAQEGHDAPGAEELRALGCRDAAIMRLGDMLSAVESMTGEGETGELAEDQASMSMVTCTLGFSAESPTCVEVARTYGRVVGEEARFFVVVQGAFSQNAACAGLYDGTGEMLQDLADKT